jgi:anti-sigma factor RsiW
MPTFEERYTAWIDGQLAGDELAEFERELESRGRADAEADRADAHRLGSLLRRQAVPAIPRPDFFNEQLLKRIAAESAPAAVPASETPAHGTFWTLPNLAWAAAVCLLASFAVYQGSHPHGRPDTGLVGSLVQPSPELLSAETEILNSVTDDPSITATPIHSEKDHMTVLWLDGLDYLPASYQLQ